MSKEMISQARDKHTRWFAAFMESIIHHHGQIDPTVAVKHHECELGQWLQREGVERYTHLKEIHELDREHRILHQHVEKLVERQQLHLRSRFEYGQIEQCKDRVMALLEVLEHKVLD